jgi:hypothetical protein
MATCFCLALELLDEFDQFQQVPSVQNRGLDTEVFEGGWWRLVGPVERDDETAIWRAPQAQSVYPSNPPDFEDLEMFTVEWMEGMRDLSPSQRFVA